jgi:hypothetical protein
MSQNEVDIWFESYEHPHKEVMLKVRQIILAADKRMEECIKWKSPTFTFKGNMASFNPGTKKHVSLMFHNGASIPGDFPDLQGGGDTVRYMTFSDLSDAEVRRDELVAIVQAWIER